MEPILILGGTGKTGRRITGRLRAAGHRVRTAARAGADLPFDLADPAGWPAALEGVRAAYLLLPGPSGPGSVPELAKAAVAAGVGRLVLLSANGMDAAPADHPLRAAEQAVRESGAEWTLLRPDWFAQNFSEAFWLAAVRSGTLALPTGDGRTPFVDAEDIAEVAAAALVEDGHAGRIYHLTGPRAIGFGEAAELIAAASGRPVRHLDVAPAEFAAAAVASGVPAQFAEQLAGLLTAIRDGRGGAVHDGVAQALGRPARRFEDYVTAAAATGCWS
ncbi:NAD(P)H-binding protein [Kitasatospora sp. NPDC006697]|uniref:NAD(P)H-binding protein n=1 Tax=Kitasatospora sp. NPDC006697 TaxID=3364020 RepID=UPI003690DED1